MKYLLMSMCLLFSCTDEKTSRRVLEFQGLSNIKVGGHAWFACGDDDHFSNVFQATNSKGQEVHGAVCCGWVKNCTVRW